MAQPAAIALRPSRRRSGCWLSRPRSDAPAARRRALQLGSHGAVALVAASSVEALLADPASVFVARGLARVCDRAGARFVLAAAPIPRPTARSSSAAHAPGRSGPVVVIGQAAPRACPGAREPGRGSRRRGAPPGTAGPRPPRRHRPTSTAGAGGRPRGMGDSGAGQLEAAPPRRTAKSPPGSRSDRHAPPPSSRSPTGSPRRFSTPPVSSASRFRGASRSPDRRPDRLAGAAPGHVSSPTSRWASWPASSCSRCWPVDRYPPRPRSRRPWPSGTTVLRPGPAEAPLAPASAPRRPSVAASSSRPAVRSPPVRLGRTRFRPASPAPAVGRRARGPCDRVRRRRGDQVLEAEPAARGDRRVRAEARGVEHRAAVHLHEARERLGHDAPAHRTEAERGDLRPAMFPSRTGKALAVVSARM